MDFYVFRMPDKTYRAMPDYSVIEVWEAESEDCWIVTARDAEQAIEKHLCGESQEHQI